jgi:hypothetical protein
VSALEADVTGFAKPCELTACVRCRSSQRQSSVAVSLAARASWAGTDSLSEAGVARFALCLEAEEESEREGPDDLQVAAEADRHAAERVARRVLDGDRRVELQPERERLAEGDEQLVACLEAILRAVVEQIVQEELQPGLEVVQARLAR